MGSALPPCAPHLFAGLSGARWPPGLLLRGQKPEQPPARSFPHQAARSQLRETSPERRQRGGEHAALHALCYLCWKQKALSSPGQRLVPGKKKKKSYFPLLLPAGAAVLDLRQQDHAPSATSSRGMNGARIRSGASITLGGQKWLVLGLSRAVVSICLGPSSL